MRLVKMQKFEVVARSECAAASVISLGGLV